MYSCNYHKSGVNYRQIIKAIEIEYGVIVLPFYNRFNFQGLQFTLTTFCMRCDIHLIKIKDGMPGEALKNS